MNSARQIAQSEYAAADSGATVSFGRERRFFFLTPLLARGAGGGGEEEVEKRRRQAHRATAMRPKTQIRAQRRAARITRRSEW